MAFCNSIHNTWQLHAVLPKQSVASWQERQGKYAHPKLLAAKKLSKNFFLLQYFNANIHNLGLKIPILEKFKKKLS